MRGISHHSNAPPSHTPYENSSAKKPTTESQVPTQPMDDDHLPSSSLTDEESILQESF